MGLDPTVDLRGLPAIRKPFTPTLGLSIAPLNSPHHEGTGGVFLRLSSEKNDTRIGLLTCAHVLHPPSLFTKNEDYTRENDSQPCEEVALLGDGAFQNAVHNITEFIQRHTSAISRWELDLKTLPPQDEREDENVASERDELTCFIRAGKFKIEEAKELHTYVTQNFAEPKSRVLGQVLHSAKIEAGATDKYMCDWGFVQLDSEKMDIPRFQGNKLFVGMSLLSFFLFFSVDSFSVLTILLIQVGTRPSPTGGSICNLKLLEICCSLSRALLPRPSYAARNTWTFTTRRRYLPSRMEALPVLRLGASTGSNPSYANTPITTLPPRGRWRSLSVATTRRGVITPYFLNVAIPVRVWWIRRVV